MPDSSDGLLQKKPHLETKFEIIGIAGNHLVVYLAVPLILRGNPCVMAFLMCWSLQLHQYNLLPLCRLVHFLKFWINEEALPPTGLCLICLKVTIFSLCAVLFYSIILNSLTLKMLQLFILLLRRRWISYQPGVPVNHVLVVLTFTQMFFVVPKSTSGMWPILNLMQLSCYIHIPTCTKPATRQVWQITHQSDFSFSINLKDTCLHILIVKYCQFFFHFVWKINLISGRFCYLGLITTPRVFTSLTKPTFSFADTRVLVLLYISMTSWFWFVLSMWARGHELFCTHWLVLGHALIVPNLIFVSQYFSFLGLFLGYSRNVCISAIW